MRLDSNEMATLDLTEAREKALEAHEQLERLAKIADDPDAYTVAEYQAAMDAAKYMERYWGSGPIASEAEEVVAAFVAQVEARRACREHRLVPQAKYDEVCAQLEQAKAARMSLLSLEDVKLVLHPVAYIPNEGEDLEGIRARLNACLAAKLGTASIGIGDPKPPPPPPPTRLTLEDLATAWSTAGIDKVVGYGLGYGPSAALVGALNETLTRKASHD